jgi:spermidine/putrescine transport system ATP-binding protein
MHGKDVVLNNVSMRFGDFVAVQPTNLVIKAGEFFSILGPSGCGKTTILRMISGFLVPSGGDILIGEESMRSVGPHKRPTALIFQSLALFPLMSVWENVAFGLEMHDWPKAKRRDRAHELLEMTAMTDQAEKRPTELSGGQRQRVAIARALAVEPAVLLLDEPLSALDLKLRQHMRAELKAIQRKTGVTFIYITHDQGEALTMSDRTAVMRDGVVEQVDTTDRIYDMPATAFVASFVGENNVIHGRVSAAADGFATLDSPHGGFRANNPGGLVVGDEAILFVRPEKMTFLARGERSENAIDVDFQRRDLEGPFVNLFFTRNGDVFAIHLTNTKKAGQDVSGETTIAFAPEDGLILAAGELADE